MIHNSFIEGLIKFDNLLNLIKSDSKHIYQLRVIETNDNTYIIVVCCFIEGLPVFIDIAEVAKQDYQDNKQRIEKLNCYIIDC